MDFLTYMAKAIAKIIIIMALVYVVVIMSIESHPPVYQANWHNNPYSTPQENSNG